MLFVSGDNSTIRQIIYDGAAFLRENQIRNVKEHPHDNGTVTLSAKAVDRFQFVLRPEVTVDPAHQRVVGCRCDCGSSFLGLCRHGAALLLFLGEEIAGEQAPELPKPSAPIRAESDMTTIEVVHRGERIGGKAVPAQTAPAKGNPLPEPSNGEEAVSAGADLCSNAADSTAVSAAAASKDGSGKEYCFTAPGIRVQLGVEKVGGQPVFWNPNDTEQLLHPNMGIIGTMGTGKTQFTKSVIYQIVKGQVNNYGRDDAGLLIFDYKGDYNETKADFVTATGARVLKPYRLPCNPLALMEPRTFKPLLPIHTANAFKDTLSKIYRFGPKQQQLLLNCIQKAYTQRGILPEDPKTWKRQAPTLANVFRIYQEETEGRAPDSLSAAVSKLQTFRIFEDSPVASGSMAELTKGVVVIDLSGYDPDIQNLVVAIILNLFYSYMLSLGSSKTDGRFRELRQLILVDEADNFMKEDFPALRRILKEGREFGVGTILSTQSLTHFMGGEDDYSRYMLTWAVHAMSDLKQKDVEYVFKLSPKSPKTATVYTTVKKLEKHQSVIKIASGAPTVICDLPFWQIVSQS